MFKIIVKVKFLRANFLFKLDCLFFVESFLRFIDKGGYNLAGFTAYNEYVSDLIIAVIIYFAGFSKLIKDMLSRRKAKAAVASAANTPLPVNEEKKEEDDK